MGIADAAAASEVPCAPRDSIGVWLGPPAAACFEAADEEEEGEDGDSDY